MVFACEKIVVSKLYEAGANRRITNIDTHVSDFFKQIDFDKYFNHILIGGYGCSRAGHRRQTACRDRQV